MRLKVRQWRWGVVSTEDSDCTGDMSTWWKDKNGEER